MKLTNIILSIVLLLLSCMPCADKDQIGSFEKVTEIHNAKQNQNKDACSPLCVCNCCGCQGFAYNTICVYNLFSVKTIIDKKTPAYKSILTSNFYGSIWQPPQINA
ncbi:DUF6660 family protein [Flavobacterium sp. LB2P53]|uniref:DUF6660 family protein n=1 Tax=Flavobacterium sp. LB2P53 TaxID=2497481 RepID=UPI000F82F7AD|nr:DUF6660 family protein [Flavobacterium sp. LB2P53]RTY67134.1 hypothetical protein EKL95_10170 [Flavobacterium sp. LB2P53]